MIEHAYAKNVHVNCQYMQSMLWLDIKSNVLAKSVTRTRERHNDWLDRITWKNLIIIFFHSIWISGVVFQVRFSLWLKFSLEIMDLHIRCSLKKKYICTKNSYIHSFCIFISCFDVMFKILFLMFCIALKKLKVNSIQNRTVC